MSLDTSRWGKYLEIQENVRDRYSASVYSNLVLYPLFPALFVLLTRDGRRCDCDIEYFLEKVEYCFNETTRLRIIMTNRT